MNRLGQLAMMFAVGVVAPACASSSPNPVAPTSPGATTSAVVVSSASTSGASFQLTATARMSDGNSRDVTSAATWESSNPVLATVSSTGMVTVVSSGELDVRATFQAVEGSIHVAVSLPGTVTLSGVIGEVAPNARPIVGARVQSVGGDHTFSDDHGAFALAGIPAGRAIIEITKAGYQTWVNEIVIDRDAQLTVNLYPAP